MKKIAKFAISFLTLGVLFSIVLGSSATAQAQIATAILYEQENPPQWNPANNIGDMYGQGDLFGIAQGFGTRLERGTGLDGIVFGLVNGDVNITATSVIRRMGLHEAAELGTGPAFGSISIAAIEGDLTGGFSGRIDLTDVEIYAIGTISGRYNLHGDGLKLNGALSGIFFFPILYGGVWIYVDGEPVTKFEEVPFAPFLLPKVKLVALLYD